VDKSDRMRSVINLLAVTVVGISVFLAGCGAESKQGPTEDAQGGSSCCPTGTDQTYQSHERQHAAKGPYGGHVIKLGDGPHHAELLHDVPAHKVIVYLFDAETKKPVAGDLKEVALRIFDGGQFVSHKLKAAVGDAGETGPTQFTSDNQELNDALLATGEVRGRLTVTIKSQPVTGFIENCLHQHAADEHDHGHDVDAPDKDE